MQISSFPEIASSPYWPYLAASAVKTTFAADQLQPLGSAEPDFDQLTSMVVEHADPIKAGPARGRWKLRDEVRRQVLATLGTPVQIQLALAANPQDAVSDPARQALAELTDGTRPPALAGRSLEELLGLERAADWLRAAGIEPSISRDDVRRRIELERLLLPLRRLVVGFEGRRDELGRLRRYVDELPSMGVFEAIGRFGRRLASAFYTRPSLVIYGPGGVGKSTLVAKFILEHLDQPHGQPMPFALLDFDRSALDPTRPDVLLLDVVGQLRIQFPEQAERLTDVEQSVSPLLSVADQGRADRSTHYDASSILRTELTAVMNEIVKTTNQNMLLVVDTFEIVQRRGPTAVYSLLDCIGQLLDEVRRLRVVLVGRSKPRREDFDFSEHIPKWDELELKGFDAVAGRAYLRQRLAKANLPAMRDADLDRLVQQVRGNPLGLRLAAQVFQREGLQGVEGAIGRQRVAAEVADEQIQGLLHARIVQQLDNDDLKKIANPGLIVRRITVDVIREVLAGPCELDLGTTTPEALFSTLRQEGALVETVDEVTLRHRPDVRLVMLPSLRRALGTQAAKIDDAAVAFWEKQGGPAARAEELYHRMWRGDLTAELEVRWQPQAGQYLEDALDEMETVSPGDLARIWLSEKLDRDIPTEIRARAGQLAWERDAERRARTLLAERKTEEALRVLNERPATARVPASPLWLLEIDIRLLRGDTSQASSAIDAALAGLDEDSHSHFTEDVLSRKVAVEERRGQFTLARGTAAQTLDLARTLNDQVAIFSAGVALCRLARRGGQPDDPEIVALHAELLGIVDTDAVRRALVEQPSLLLEATAELGAESPELLADAMERIGLTPTNVGRETPPGALDPSFAAVASQVPWLLGPDSKDPQPRDLTGTLAQMVRENRLDTKPLIEIAQQAVERLLGQTVR